MNNTNNPGLLAEWAPQCATMLVWPHSDTDWSPWLVEITATYIELTRIITRHQPVLLICKNLSHENSIRARLKTDEQDAQSCPYPVIFLSAAYNDTWCRDFGPITIQNQQTVALLDFRFNGWGDKYTSDLDDQLCATMDQLQIFSAPLTSVDFHLEGGSIDCNGEGLVLTTEACLLSDSRNAKLTKSDIEQKLLTLFNCKKILWLSHGELIGDDTDSHVDNLARFVNTNTIVYASTDISDDIHHAPLCAMEKQLHQLNAENNLGLQLIPIPIPDPLYDESSGNRLPASYINFILINNAVIVPTFGVPQDELAITTFASLFPTREIHTINANPLIKQFGGPHCASMQFPVGTLDIAALSSQQMAAKIRRIQP